MVNFKNIVSEFGNKPILFNQFEKYPSINNNGWIDFTLQKLNNNDKNIKFINVDFNSSIVIVEIQNSEWDYEHFGFRIAKINNPIIINNCNKQAADKSVKKALEICKKIGIKLVISRVNGDNLTFVHTLENSGFKYYETIIWPVAELKNILCDNNIENDVTYFNPLVDDIESVKLIAKNYQYQRSHFHCDCKIDNKLVDSLYEKWVQSAFDSGKKIAIIKRSNKIEGYFICDVDEKLSNALGSKYGRLQSLALNKTVRGQGIGKRLFEGTLRLLKNDSCTYVDSGYATKNHLSAKFHVDYGFHSVYEEVTMHYWL